MPIRLQLILLIFLANQLSAQQQFRTELLDIRDGLSQNYVSSIAQDREGFLWAGTKNGLNRYDGRTFKIWTNDPENQNSLSNDWVWTLDQHEDFLLIGTNGGGVDIFDRRRERFFHLPRPPEIGGVVKCLRLDPQKRHLWLIAPGKVEDLCFFRLRLPDDFWKKLAAGDISVLQKIETQRLAAGYFQRFLFSADGKTVWGVAGKFYAQFDAATGQMLRSVNIPADFTGYQEFGALDSAGQIWCLQASRLMRFDGEKWTTSPLQMSPFARLVGTDWQGRLLIVDSDKLFAFDSKKIGTGAPIPTAAADWQCTVGGQPTQSLLDQSGIFWFGTNAGGIQKLNFRRPMFRHFFAGRSIYSTPFEDSDGSFGYYNFGEGMAFSEKNASGLVARFAQKHSNRMFYGRVFRDPMGNFWIFQSMWQDYHLAKIAPDGSSKIYPFEPTGKQMGNFFMDEAGIIWIGSNATLNRFDPASEQWQKFNFRQVLPDEHEVFALTKTGENTIWMGTSQGLVCGKLNGRKIQNPSDAGEIEFSIFKNDPANPNSLRNNAVAALLADPTDAAILWIGTKGGGLTRLDTRDGKMRHLSTRDGLPNDVIYNILATPARPTPADLRLWLSSNKGIIRYAPATGEIRNFTEADGAQSDEFNTWAAAKTSRGTLLFGGLNGLNELDPAHFSDNPNLPPVFLTSLKINNRPIVAGDSTGLLPQNLEFLGKIELPFSKNSLTLTFAALEFTVPTKNRFRYFLENAELEWAHETTENSATYLNLAPGNYTFKIIAANGDGSWNPHAAELKIHILPPWWRSWWAYLFYLLVAAVAVRWFYRFQWQRRLEHAENLRLKELDSFKSRLYANITHEFRTPLTVILGNTDLLEKENPPNSKFETVRRNARRLLTLVNQILDLSKVENNALRLEMRQSDVVAFLKYLVESFQSFANTNNQALRFSSDFAHFNMDFDAERLHQVLSNLISNALKFTPQGGQVLVEVKNSGADWLEISVSDTGVGIAPEDLPQVFDRFFQAKNQSENKAGGTGIGLALTKELVKLFGGEILVESQVGRGTKFTVKLPVTKNAPLAESQILPLLEILPPSISEKSDRPPATTRRLPSLLVIEDSPDVVAYLKNILQEKFQISVAYNGRAGLEMAFADVPDLVLSDLMMPEKDGLEVCSELKNDPRTSHIPVVLLTARAAVEDRVAGISRGVDAYLAKPFHHTELLVTLEKLLENRARLQAFFSKKLLEPDQPTDQVIEPEEQFLQNLRAFILEKMQDSSLSLDDLCRAAGMGKSNLSAKMSALTGQSPMIFLRNLRLARARDLLAAGGRNVSEVAFEVGFEDPKYFSRAFSEAFGKAPSAFLNA